MGIVYSAVDTRLGRTVALKVLPPSKSNDPKRRQRFLREARAAAAVAHEHVIAVHAVVESSGLPFLVMEYVPGRSLQERIDQDGPLALGGRALAGAAIGHANQPFIATPAAEEKFSPASDAGIAAAGILAEQLFDSSTVSPTTSAYSSVVA